MGFDVFKVDGLDAFRFERNGARVKIGEKSRFMKLLSGYARSKYPGMPESLDMADVHVILQSVAPFARTSVNSIPEQFPVGEIPFNTSRLFFAFHFPRDEEIVLLGGIHVCRTVNASMTKSMLLKVGSPDIWLRLRDTPMPEIFPLYAQPVTEDIPRTEAMAAIEWRLFILVTGDGSLMNTVNKTRSKVEKIAMALDWHHATFSEDTRMSDEYSYWLSLGASPTFPEPVYLLWREAERWLIFIRACLLCKSEDDFDAVLAANTTSLGDISQYGFRPVGPRIRGRPGPSDPWLKAPPICPHPRFASLYSQYGNRRVRQSVVEELARGDALIQGQLDIHDLAGYFDRRFDNVDKVATKLGLPFGTTGFGDFGTLAVKFAPTRNVYEAPFEDALEALTSRKGIMSKGRIFIPWFQAFELIQSLFDRRCKAVPSPQHIFDRDFDELCEQSKSIAHKMRIDKVLRASQYRPKNMPTIWDLEAALPPCMMSIMDTLKRDKRIGNVERFAFVPFLLKMGYSIETITLLLERHWDAQDWHTGDAKDEMPKWQDRYEKWRSSSTGRGFGLGCKGMASSGLCTVVSNIPNQELGRLYGQKVVDIEDCADSAERCRNVMNWRKGKRGGKPITSPQSFVYRVIKA